MVCRVNLTANLCDATDDSSRRLVVDDGHGLDLVSAIVRQFRVHRRRIHAVVPVSDNPFHLEAEAHPDDHVTPRDQPRTAATLESDEPFSDDYQARTASQVLDTLIAERERAQ